MSALQNLHNLPGARSQCDQSKWSPTWSSGTKRPMPATRAQIIHRGRYKSLSKQARGWLKRRQAVEPAVEHFEVASSA